MFCSENARITQTCSSRIRQIMFDIVVLQGLSIFSSILFRSFSCVLPCSVLPFFPVLYKYYKSINIFCFSFFLSFFLSACLAVLLSLFYTQYQQTTGASKYASCKQTEVQARKCTTIDNRNFMNVFKST